MKKILFAFTALLLGSSLTYGYDEIPYMPGFEPADQAVAGLENPSSLTPKRPQTAAQGQQTPPQLTVPDVSPPVIALLPQASAYTPAPVYVAQAPAVTTVAEPVSGTSDAHLYAELERLSEAIQHLQKDTAKPDLKKSFSAPKIGGRILFDSFTINQSSDHQPRNFQNKAGLRELRVTLTGTGYEAFDYKAELVTNTEGQINFNDVWVGAKHVPGFGYLRVGQYNVETGIGYLSGSTNTTSTEYLPPASAFLINRRAGISSEHLFAKDHIRWFYGIFQGDDIRMHRALTQDDQGPIFNTRLTALPYYAKDGKHMLHIGGHYSYIAASSDTQRIQTFIGGSGWNLGSPAILTTGTILSNHSHRSGLELFYQSGPLSIMSEAFFARYGASDNDRLATGASVELAYFLTGEHRTYSKSTALLGAPTMNHPFQPFKCGDWNLVKHLGAWQVFTQYGYVDLGDWRDAGTAGAIGGLQHDLTVGVNWYWAPTLRWVFEYTHSQQNVGPAYTHYEQDIFGARVQMSW